MVWACGSTPPVVTSPTQDTLEAHARAHDEEGLKRASTALKGKVESDRMRGLAAMLEYESVKLLPHFDALADRAAHAETDEEKAAAAWVLVHAGDIRVASVALALKDGGALEHVKKLDGSNAFDAVALARLLATTTVPAEQTVSRRKTIAAALPAADAKTRLLLVRAITEDAEDGTVLVLAAEALDPQKDFAVLEHVFQRIRVLADPRAADALARYADHASHPHFRTEAAVRLAELGDLRAAPHLAWRMSEDPTKLYDAIDPNTLQLTRDDRERVTAARMLADLAVIHPEARTQLREMAETPMIGWMRQHAQPHANALRFLVLVESPQAAAMVKKLADPPDALPSAGMASFPEAFATAQSALRYLGMTHDASAFAILDKQLNRKPASFDGSMDAIAKGGSAIAGMTYRALAYGAAEGFSELGDAKAIPLLVRVAEDEKQNEQVRVAACAAVGALADGHARADIVAKVRAFATDRKRELVRSCWLMGLAQRPRSREDAPLLALVAPKVEPESRHQAARVLGEGGLAAPERAKLVEMLKDKALVHDAALALLFGGDDASVASVFAAYAPSDADGATTPPPIEPLRQLYAQSVPILTDDIIESGALARIATLAIAAKSVSLRGAKQDWVLQGLAYQLRQSGELDSGPHTMTRVRLRARLLADAKTTDAKKRDDALLLLWLFGERAALESLGDVAKSRLAEASP